MPDKAISQTPIEKLEGELFKLWTPLMVAGFRDDMHDILHWVCYCRNHQPVTYSYFHGMQCHAVPLPHFSNEQIKQAVSELDDSESRRMLLSWIDRA